MKFKFFAKKFKKKILFPNIFRILFVSIVIFRRTYDNVATKKMTPHGRSFQSLFKSIYSRVSTPLVNLNSSEKSLHALSAPS